MSGVQLLYCGRARVGARREGRRRGGAQRRRCKQRGQAAALAHCPSPAEPEEALRSSLRIVPRLKTAPESFEGLVRLHFHSRGAVSNLFIELQPPLASSQPLDVVLDVRAVGLNFRDVLNVLGEYPGDPGPPGGDASGVISAGAFSPHPVIILQGGSGCSDGSGSHITVVAVVGRFVTSNDGHGHVC